MSNSFIKVLAIDTLGKANFYATLKGNKFPKLKNSYKPICKREDNYRSSLTNCVLRPMLYTFLQRYQGHCPQRPTELSVARIRQREGPMEKE